MWKSFVPIIVGVAVGLATAPVAIGIIFGMAWSGIHSGRTDPPGDFENGLMGVATFCVLALPFGLGLLATRATEHAMRRSLRSVAAEREEVDRSRPES
jgi:hypothetical protein